MQDFFDQSMKKPYNEKSARSIEAHGKKLLEAGTLRKATCVVPIPKTGLTAVTGGKTRGSFGKVLEENYYGIRPGNSSEPDFPEAGRAEIDTTDKVFRPLSGKGTVGARLDQLSGGGWQRFCTVLA